MRLLLDGAPRAAIGGPGRGAWPTGFDVRRWRKCEFRAISRQLLSEKFRNENFPRSFRDIILLVITEDIEIGVAKRGWRNLNDI
jgi:hypothetical protein